MVSSTLALPGARLLVSFLSLTEHTRGLVILYYVQVDGEGTQGMPRL